MTGNRAWWIRCVFFVQYSSRLQYERNSCASAGASGFEHRTEKYHTYAPSVKTPTSIVNTSIEAKCGAMLALVIKVYANCRSLLARAGYRCSCFAESAAGGEREFSYDMHVFK